MSRICKLNNNISIFLQIQTELAYVTKYRDDLVAKMEPKQRSIFLEYSQKLKEKVIHFLA